MEYWYSSQNVCEGRCYKDPVLGGGVCTLISKLCFLLTSSMNLYISVLLGSECSQSFLGTVRESILGLKKKRYKRRYKKRPAEDSCIGKKKMRRELPQYLEVHCDSAMRGKPILGSG